LVRGEDRYQEAIRSLAGPPRKHGYLIPVAVNLSREPKNPSDEKALLAEVNGLKVGYLAREFAAQASPVMDKARCSNFVLAGLIRGGANRAKTLGVHVWTARRLSPGPGIDGIELPEFEVRWPPYGVEGSDRED